MPDRLLKRRYRILTRIGEGGMGIVYKAEDLLCKKRLVAVKEMNAGGLPPEVVEAFEQEASLLAHLSHPRLPSMHDYFYEARRTSSTIPTGSGTLIRVILVEFCKMTGRRSTRARWTS